MTNTARVEMAMEALQAYQNVHGQDELETDIVDLIADLLHMARQNNLDPDKMTRMALMHCECELDEENQDS